MEGNVGLVGGLLEEHSAGQVRHADVELDHGTTATLHHAPADEEGITNNVHMEITGRFGSGGGLKSHAGGGAGVSLLHTLVIGETPGKGVALLRGETGDLERKRERMREKRKHVRGIPIRGKCHLPQKHARKS